MPDTHSELEIWTEALEALHGKLKLEIIDDGETLQATDAEGKVVGLTRIKPWPTQDQPDSA